MNKTYTVNQLARLAGISVRMLHHYDEIGLLKPAFSGENRYRYYGEEELLRLQQILIYRELDMPLSEIGTILDAPGFDRLTTLQRQRERLEEQAKRYADMVLTIDRTIARLKGERTMTDADLYSGIVSLEKQAEYEAWLIERYGAGLKSEIDSNRRAMAELSEAEQAAMMEELRLVDDGLAEGLRRGLPPQATALDPLIERHRAWVASAWARDCPLDAYVGLAEVYEHRDFRKRYEAIEPGFADYLVTAMRAWARRQA